MQDIENRNPSLAYSIEPCSEPVIFRYQLLDAWGVLISQVDILDNEKENVRCMYACSWRCNLREMEGKMPSAQSVTLDREKIRKVQSILLSRMNVFEIKELERPVCFDGFRNVFSFSLARLTNTIRGSNLWVYDEGIEDSVYAKVILDVFHDVKTILLDAGVEKKYLTLALEDE